MNKRDISLHFRIVTISFQVIKEIGPERFRGITSDNTGNTSAARKLIHEAYPSIIILPDPCHRLNLLCKDISKMDAFKEVSAFFDLFSQGDTDYFCARSSLKSSGSFNTFESQRIVLLSLNSSAVR